MRYELCIMATLQQGNAGSKIQVLPSARCLQNSCVDVQSEGNELPFAPERKEKNSKLFQVPHDIRPRMHAMRVEVRDHNGRCV